MNWTRRSLFVVTLLLVADLAAAVWLFQAWQERFGDGSVQARERQLGSAQSSPGPLARTGSTDTLVATQR